MRGFGKRNGPHDELGQELRRRRPRPRGEFVAGQVARIEASRPTRSRGIGIRPRLVLAVVTTGLLCVAAGATGGLGYADTAASHTVRAFAHVFTADRTAQAQHEQGQAAQSGSARSGSDQSANTQSRSEGQQQGDQRRTESENGQGNQGNDNGQGNENGQGDHHHNPGNGQYGRFVFICLRVPPRHPVVNITLFVPTAVGAQLVARGLATPGPC